MSLTQVGNFVGNHRRKFILGLGIFEQAIVNANDSPWHGEGVDVWVVDDDKFDPSILQFAVGYQFEDQRLKIAIQDGIVDQRCLTTKRFQPIPTQFMFIFG